MMVPFMQLPAWQKHQTCFNTIQGMTEAVPFSKEDSDEDLMLKTGQGDESALTTLINRWKNPLINFFFRSLSSVEQSEDLAQMVFIRIYRAAPKYQPTAKFSTFLFHIARRLLINEYRRRTRKPLEFVNPDDIQGSQSGRETLRINEIEEMFRTALEDLPENQRTAILLLKQQELSYQEIAEVMKTTESSVKTWIFRARRHLKNALKNRL